MEIEIVGIIKQSNESDEEEDYSSSSSSDDNSSSFGIIKGQILNKTYQFKTKLTYK